MCLGPIINGSENRPEKKNTLTNKVVQGVADGIDKASRSKEVSAIDAATAYRIGLVSQVVEPDDLADFVEAEAKRFKHIPANQLALNKLLINQAFENMGLRTTQLLGTLFDGVTRHTEEAYRWEESFQEKGFRKVISERDAPWQDYGEKPKED